jgi:hypothetical protein
LKDKKCGEWKENGQGEKEDGREVEKEEKE